MISFTSCFFPLIIDSNKFFLVIIFKFKNKTIQFKNRKYFSLYNWTWKKQLKKNLKLIQKFLILFFLGVLTDVQSYFNVEDDKAGLLQTAFVLSYMLCAPLFGYFGDRYSRRWIMIVGVALWSGTTLLGSYMQSFGWFLAFRALVGIGEASYSTIAPTIISDLFVGDLRSKMLAVFYFAIPVGSGLGYIIGAQTAQLLGSWRWALRVTPVLGALAIVLIYLTKDPERGESEGTHNMEVTSYKEDLKGLLIQFRKKNWIKLILLYIILALGKNRSFMLSTFGFTCVAFVAGALAWWGPSFIHLGMQLQPGNENIALNE